MKKRTKMPDQTMTEKITIVFDVIDRVAMRSFYEAHGRGMPVHGCVPRILILTWGDQVTSPADLMASGVPTLASWGDIEPQPNDPNDWMPDG